MESDTRALLPSRPRLLPLLLILAVARHAGGQIRLDQLPTGAQAAQSGPCAPGARADIHGMCDLVGVHSLAANAAEAGGEHAAVIEDLPWSGSVMPGRALDGDGAPVDKPSPAMIGPAPDSAQPLIGPDAAASAAPTGAAAAAESWQPDLDAARRLMTTAGQLISASSISVFIGKLLLHTLWGASAGAAMIAAGMAMAGAAAGLAGAATVLGAIILLKYDQKLQGAVVTLSAAALTVGAVMAANGDRTAYGAAESKIGAIAGNASDLTAQALAQQTSVLSIGYQNMISVAQAGFDLTPLSRTQVGSIMNAGFGLEAGFNGLLNNPGGNGGLLAGFQVGMGATGIVAGIVPVKGEAGEILSGALSATSIALDMVPTGGSTPEEQNAAVPDSAPPAPEATMLDNPPDLAFAPTPPAPDLALGGPVPIETTLDAPPADQVRVIDIRQAIAEYSSPQPITLNLDDDGMPVISASALDPNTRLVVVDGRLVKQTADANGFFPSNAPLSPAQQLHDVFVNQGAAATRSLVNDFTNGDGDGNGNPFNMPGDLASMFLNGVGADPASLLPGEQLIVGIHNDGKPGVNTFQVIRGAVSVADVLFSVAGPVMEAFSSAGAAAAGETAGLVLEESLPAVNPIVAPALPVVAKAP